VLNLEADMVTTPLPNFNMDLKPAESVCIQYLNICLYKA